MKETMKENLKPFKWPLAISFGVHILVMLLTVTGAVSFASPKREKPEEKEKAILLPVEWVFTPDGDDDNVPGEEGGKAVEEKPMVAKGKPGGVNTPTPPKNPDRSTPHGQREVTAPKDKPPTPSPLPAKKGTVNVPTRVPDNADEGKDVTGEAKGSPNGQTGKDNGKDANTSGQSDTGGGPSKGAGYGGPGFDGPARSKEAENYGWNGRVTVRVSLSPSGSVTGVSVVGSSGTSGLDRECVSRVRSAPSSAFTGALDKGVAVAGEVTLSCYFPPVE